jgi:hypothetical protein
MPISSEADRHFFCKHELVLASPAQCHSNSQDAYAKQRGVTWFRHLAAVDRTRNIPW